MVRPCGLELQSPKWSAIGVKNALAATTCLVSRTVVRGYNLPFDPDTGSRDDRSRKTFPFSAHHHS